MNSDTIGISDDRGLRGKIQVEEDESRDESNIVSESCIDLSLTPKANPPIPIARPPLCSSISMEAEISSDKIRNSVFSRLDPSDFMRRCLIRLGLSSNENPQIPFVPLSDLPPMEAAFSIEKISQTVFSFLEPQDLLKCRLVSSSWLRIGTNDKRLKCNKKLIEITHDLRLNNTPDVTLKGRRRRFKDVKYLLDGLCSHPSPFSASLNLHMTLGQKDSLKLIDRYGFVINTLKVTLYGTKERKSDIVYHMDSLLDFLTKLLTEQMPNLESLLIDFRASTFTGEIEPQLLELIRNGLYSAGKQNQSLRIIELRGQPPCEIIDALCCLAPKLEELLMFNLWEIYRNRLHLFKSLKFEPKIDYLDEVDALEALLDTEEKINLKWFFPDFRHVSDVPDLWPRLATLVINILEKSCHSLEELVLGPIYFLPGTVLPQMPNVKELTFYQSDYGQFEQSFWPEETSISFTFPNLHTINFYMDNSIMKFLSLCMNEEVASVKTIQHTSFDIAKNVFETRFPNAIVTVPDPVEVLDSGPELDSHLENNLGKKNTGMNFRLRNSKKLGGLQNFSRSSGGPIRF